MGLTHTRRTTTDAPVGAATTSWLTLLAKGEKGVAMRRPKRWLVSATAAISLVAGLLVTAAGTATAAPVYSGASVIYAELRCNQYTATVDPPLTDQSYEYSIYEDGYVDYVQYQWFVNTGTGWYNPTNANMDLLKNNDNGSPWGSNLAQQWYNTRTNSVAGSFTRAFPPGAQVAVKVYLASGRSLAVTHDWTYYTWAHTKGNLPAYWWEYSCTIPKPYDFTVGGAPAPGVY